MERIKGIYKSFVIIFSEAVWIYYIIAMFANMEWNSHAFFNPAWLAAAGAVGYALNAVLSKISNNIIFSLGNIAAMGFVIVQNWRTAVPEGYLVFGLGTSIGIGIIFVRSAMLVYRKPSRRDILRRFEGNVIYYIVMAAIFTLGKWSNETFHLIFIAAIAGCLMGIVLALQNGDNIQYDQKVKVIKAGHSRWFAGAMTVLLACISVFSLTLLLPSVNRVVYALGLGIWEALKWAALELSRFLTWLAGFLPKLDVGPMPDKPSGQGVIPTDELGKKLIDMPYIWALGIIAIAAVAAAISLLVKLIKNRKLPKTGRLQYVTVTREPWRANLRRHLSDYMKYLKLKWLMSFSRSYYNSIYWYYNQVLRWGKKNGLPKLNSETSREYIGRIIANMPEQENDSNCKDQCCQLPELLERLNAEYQACYYGGKSQIAGETEYKQLIRHLQNIHL